MSRHWLVAVSVTAHLCILAGVFVSGIWRLERLEGGPPRFTLAVQPPPPPPAPAGGSKAPRPLDFTPKTPPRVVKGTHQPVPHVDTPPPDVTPRGDGDSEGSGSGPAIEGATCTENCAGDAPADPVCGNRSVEAGERCDDGNTTAGDGCSATCQIEVKPAPPTATVAPSVLAGLRVSGETQVHPDALTQSQMIRDGAGRVAGVVKLCIAASGSVGSTRLLASTKYPAYDAALVAAVAGWRYQPYQVNGTAVPACSTVRFVYTIQ